MSDLPRCPNCDARTDPYGRDGGHSWCMKCREEAGHFSERADLEPKHVGDGRWSVAA